MLEVCVDSVESAEIATGAGAERLELCQALIIGGLTPTITTFRAIRRRCEIPIRILIRPRFGDFLYSESEFEVIKEEVKLFKEEGADGVVIGILKENGSLDFERMEELISLTGDMGLTLHRAFDVCKNPFKTLEEAIQLGIDTILTSGQESSAIKGVSLLKNLYEKAENKLHLMAGSGVTASVIPEIHEKTGIEHYHLSAKKILESQMIFRKKGVPMGLPDFSEFEIYQTDEKQVREAKKVIKNLRKD